MNRASKTTPQGEPVLGQLAPTLLEEELAIDEGSRGSARGILLARLLGLGDILAASVATLMACVAGGIDAPAAWLFFALTLPLWFTAHFAAGLYQLDTLGVWASGISQLGRMAGVALLVSWPLAGLAAVMRAESAVIAGLTVAIVGFVLAVLARTVARGLLHRVVPLRQRTLILGSGLVAGRLVERLRRHSELGLDPIGLVDDDVHIVGPPALPVLGELSDLRSVLESQRVDRVIVAFTRASHEQLLESMRACREQRVAVDVVPRLFEFLEGARAIERIGGLPLLSIGAQPLGRSSAVAKRILDVLLGSIALTALLPVLLLIALAVKLDSRGPVLFRQVRAGRGGQPFGLVKFRSMHTDADARKDDVVAQNDIADGVMFKIHHDPRVTRVGRILRRTSLDELPQLFNVVRGEMSLVGPRPLILAESDALDQAWHARRLDLRPGLTGPWQVSGRSDLDVHDMVRLDFQYVTGWSLARDLEILLATLPAVLAQRGAY